MDNASTDRGDVAEKRSYPYVKYAITQSGQRGRQSIHINQDNASIDRGNKAENRSLSYAKYAITQGGQQRQMIYTSQENASTGRGTGPVHNPEMQK